MGSVAEMATAYVALFSKVAFLCVVLSANMCNGDLFGSLQFTRDALFGFSRVVTKPAIEKPRIDFDLGRSL